MAHGSDAAAAGLCLLLPFFFPGPCHTLPCSLHPGHRWRPLAQYDLFGAGPLKSSLPGSDVSVGNGRGTGRPKKLGGSRVENENAPCHANATTKPHAACLLARLVSTATVLLLLLPPRTGREAADVDEDHQPSSSFVISIIILLILILFLLVPIIACLLLLRKAKSVFRHQNEQPSAILYPNPPLRVCISMSISTSTSRSCPSPNHQYHISL